MLSFSNRHNFLLFGNWKQQSTRVHILFQFIFYRPSYYLLTLSDVQEEQDSSE